MQYDQSAQIIKPAKATESTASLSEIRNGELDMGWKVRAPSNGKPKSKNTKRSAHLLLASAVQSIAIKNTCFVGSAMALRHDYSKVSRLKKASIALFCLSSNSLSSAARF